MKKNNMILAGALLCVGMTLGTSCQKFSVEDEQTIEPAPDVQEGVHLSVKAGIFDFGEVTRAATAASRCAFVLLDAEGNQVVSQEKTSEDAAYMQLDAVVPYGDYRLIIVGHNGTQPVSVSKEAIISFGDEKLTDTFLKYTPISLKKDAPETVQIYNLTRVVSKFAIRHTDALPENVNKMQIKFTGGGNQLNAETGMAANSVEQTRNIMIPRSAQGTKNNAFSIYTFLPTEDATLQVTSTAMSSTGETVISRTFSDVPVSINQQTTYEGVYFNSESSLKAQINAEWKPDKNVGF